MPKVDTPLTGNVIGDDDLVRSPLLQHLEDDVVHVKVVFAFMQVCDGRWTSHIMSRTDYRTNTTGCSSFPT